MNNTKSLKAAQIISCINSCVSCLASTIIILMILTNRPEKGLASPYSRIIFAMSISDVLFSVASLLSPFMGPKDNPDALYAIGTTESCEAIGFLFILGVHGLIFYLVFLTYYFMRRIKYKVTPQTFAKKEEKYFHIAFFIITLPLGIAAVFTESINPQGFGSLCGISPYPEYCTTESWEGETCKRGGGNITKTLQIYGGVLVGLASLVMVFILALFSHHVYKEERTLTIPARAIGDNHPRGVAPENAEIEDRDSQNRHKLTKQALTQSFLYIMAFNIVYFPPTIHLLRRTFGKTTDLPDWLFWLISLISPLGGVFNIIIYTRPKVLRLKEDYPNASMLRLFIAIVLTGGEIPSLADLRREVEITPELEHRNNRNYQEGNVLDEQEELFNDGEQVNRYEQDDDLFSYEMDVSAASEYLSYSGSGRISSFWQFRSS